MKRGRMATVSMAAFLGSLPIFALPVLLLIQFLHSTGDPAQATLVVGAYALANAAGLSLQGRLMGRVDHRLVLGAAAVVHATALIVLPHLSGVYVISACIIAGLAFPEINASLRTLLIRTEVGTRSQKRLSVSVASFEVAAVTGPLLGALAVRLANPQVTLAVSAAWMAAATAIYIVAIAGVPAAVPQQAPAGGRTPDWALMVFAVAPAACYSLLATAAGLAAAAAGSTVMVGAVRAALSLGALLGAVWLSLRPAHSPQRPIIAGFVTLGVISLAAMLTASPWAAVVLFLAGGCAFTPISVSMTLLVDRAKAAATIGMLHAATVLSGGLFTAVAGPLYRQGGVALPYCVSAVVAAAGALIALRQVMDAHRSPTAPPVAAPAADPM